MGRAKEWFLLYSTPWVVRAAAALKLRSEVRYDRIVRRSVPYERLRLSSVRSRAFIAEFDAAVADDASATSFAISVTVIIESTCSCKFLHNFVHTQYYADEAARLVSVSPSLAS